MSYKTKNQLDLFLDIEFENSLFEVKSKFGHSIWDVIRFDVWMKISRSNSNQTNKKYKTYNNIIRTVKSIKNIFFKNYKYFLLSHSRFLNDKKEFYDPFYELIQSNTDKETFVYEKMIDKKNLANKNSVLDFIYYLNKIFLKIPFFKKIFVTKSDTNKILNFLRSSFKTTEFNEDELVELLGLFYLEKIFYKWILKYKKIEKVFFHGYSKSLLSATSELEIKSYEFQHGDISETTFLYKYKKETLKKYRKSIIIPDNILLYSSVWEKNIQLPSKIIEIGSVFHNIKPKQNSIKPNHLAVISSPLENNLLINFAKKLAILNSDLKIYYKLHPSQYHLMNKHKIIFEDFKNIEIVREDISVSDLSVFVDQFVVYYSTVVYELLQLKKIIFLIKGRYHLTLKKYFNFSNIILINNPEDIIKLNKDKMRIVKRSEISFFKPLIQKNLNKIFK